MDTNQALSNLEYLKTLAESGKRSPLLGGQIGLVWTILLVPTLVIHGLILNQTIPLAPNHIWVLWLIFSVIGTIASSVLSYGLGQKQGKGTTANQIGAVIWLYASLLIFGFAISIFAGYTLAGLSPVAFNFIMPFTFGIIAMNYAVIGRITGETYLSWASRSSGLFVFLTAAFAAMPFVHYLAAFGVFISGVIPSLIEVRKEAVGE